MRHHRLHHAGIVFGLRSRTLGIFPFRVATLLLPIYAHHNPSPSNSYRRQTHLYAAMLFSRKYFSRAVSLFSAKYSRTMPMTWPYVPKGSLFGQSLP